MPGIEAHTIRYLSPASSHSCSSATKTNCAQALSLFLPSKLLTSHQFVLAAIHPRSSSAAQTNCTSVRLHENRIHLSILIVVKQYECHS